jgi:SM-20-related protein
MFTDNFKKEIKIFSDKISEDGYWICDDVFTNDSLESLLSSFESKREFLRPALIGKRSEKTQADEIRNDQITWLKGDEEGFSPVWILLDMVNSKARSELFLPIKRFEAHISLYPPGHFYKRHKDKHQKSPSRLISSVLYFNRWSLEDAGELVIYKPDGEEIKIEPTLNKVIFFKSELEHEVLPAFKERRSLTAWLRDDLD